MEMESEWSKVPVTSLCHSQDLGLLLVGQGQFVLLLTTGDQSSVTTASGDILARLQVFRGAVVHSIQRHSGDSWLVRGGKSLALVTVTEARRLEVLVPETVHEDWIMASDATGVIVSLLTAHNKLLTLGELGEVTEARTAECGPCILYSGLLHCREDGVTVMAGTVFGKLIIWNGWTGGVINSLGGHDGVIFSVSYRWVR